MRSTFLMIFSLLFCFNLSAQHAETVYVELGGPGLISANFDMRFSKQNTGLGGRIGIGGFSLNNDYDGRVSLLTIPVGLNYLLGKDGKNFFELGAGFTYLNVGSRYDSENSTLQASFGNLTFGYRLAPANGGFVFKAQITPVFNKYGFMPYYGGIGFGYKF
ncbi:MAG: hypothetical protein ABIN48_07780 [Ginsengibacter sp.]